MVAAAGGSGSAPFPDAPRFTVDRVVDTIPHGAVYNGRMGDSPTEAGAIRDVSDTALWVAAYRAEENERPKALFRDPFARELAGERGFAVLDAMPKARAHAWPMLVRTVIFDRFVEERVAAGCDLVINLAAGLDARPYRMALPAALRWIEIDLPKMIAYKSAVLAAHQPHCRLERIAVDLTDGDGRRAALVQATAGSREALVLSEGLLIYLDRQHVIGLARELTATPQLRWWATDLASPGLLKYMDRTWGDAVSRSPFRFGPEEGPAFFEPLGWTPREVINSFYAAARLERLPLMLRPFSWLPKPKRWNPRMVWSGQCLLERVEPTGGAPGA